MNKFTIYHNPKCSTSRKALEILKNHNIEPTIIEYLKTPPELKTLEEFRKYIPINELVRTKEPIFNELQLNLEDDVNVLKAIAENPILLQRPIIICDGKPIMARPPEKILTWLE